VLDFGISKATMTGRVFDTDLAVIKTQSLLGSPVYMSPEQMRGKDVDHRVDIWSLGALLYEIVSGNVAFSGTSVTEICALVLETEPPPLSPELVPPAFAAVILKCLRKDPAARYQNVGELALALMPFGPSRSRIWAERVVALLRAHGADLDDSIFKSIPPPGMFSGPPNSGPPNSGPPNSSTRVVISGAPSSDSMPVISSGVIPPSSALPIITADLRATAPSVAPERRSGRPIVIAAAIGALLLGLAAWALLGRSSPPHAAAAATTAESPPATVGVSSRPVAPIGDAPVQGSAASAAASSSAASPTSTAATLGSAPRAAAATGSGSAKPAWAVGGAKPAGTKPSASVPSSTGTGNTMHQDAAPAARAKIVDDAPRAKIVE
jgi:serine/threonine-protein kinase